MCKGSKIQLDVLEALLSHSCYSIFFNGSLQLFELILKVEHFFFSSFGTLCHLVFSSVQSLKVFFVFCERYFKLVVRPLHLSQLFFVWFRFIFLFFNLFFLLLLLLLHFINFLI